MVYMIVLSVIAGALGIYYFFFKDTNIFKKHGIPHMRPLPFLGNMGQSVFRMKSVGEVVKMVYDEFPEAKYVGIYDMTTPAVMLRDPELIKSITVKNFDIFMNRGHFVQEDQEPFFGKNLFGLRGEKWRDMRSLLSPTFTSSKMKNMFKLMSDYAVDFTNFLAQLPPEKKVMETKDIFTRYTNDMIGTCAFGVSIDSMRDPNNLFYVYGREVAVFDISVFFKLIVLRMAPWLARLLGVKIVREQVAMFFQDLVETTIKTRDEKGIVRPDVLQLMMESRSRTDGKKGLTIEDMTIQAFTFFTGGFESTSTLMCFAAHEIAVNEDVRARLQSEIDQVLEDTSGQAPYEAINNMEYLEAVINETLRKYPVAVMTDRLCERDFEFPPALPGYEPFIMKKGQTVWIPVYGLHHDPKYFKDPEKFDPNRFLGEEKKHTVNSGAYVPFGSGPRMCIGNRFALLETKVLLFHLLARCDLLPCEKTPIPLKLAKDGLNMKPQGGFWLKMEPRKNLHRTITISSGEDTCKL